MEVSAGSLLDIKRIRRRGQHPNPGYRCYLAVRGGLDVAEYLGSRATFPGGSMGGMNGRQLKVGALLGMLLCSQ